MIGIQGVNVSTMAVANPMGQSAHLYRKSTAEGCDRTAISPLGLRP